LALQGVTIVATTAIFDSNSHIKHVGFASVVVLLLYGKAGVPFEGVRMGGERERGAVKRGDTCKFQGFKASTAAMQ
jgi:hypothetical protein